MSGRHPTPLWFWLTLLVCVVLVNAFLLHGSLGHRVAGVSAPAASWTVKLMRDVRDTAAGLGVRQGSAARIAELEDELARLRSRGALDDALVRERDLYRAAAGIRERMGREPVVAGIFAYPRAGGAIEVVINRGTNDWIADGDIVLTQEGVVLGVVRETWEDHGVVTLIEDPSVQAAARISGTDITGLVRPDTDGGLVLDLVSKDEPVTEGQVVETAGSDRFPPALIIGTVRSVDATQATLFSLVRVQRAPQAARAVQVLVIRSR